MAQRKASQLASAAATEEVNSVNYLASSSLEDKIAKFELVRSWGLEYDGGHKVFNFIDRLEELAGMYEINLNCVVPMMFELLRDRALIWLRNNRKPWEHWFQFKKDFLGFFLPPRYFDQLEDEIRKRTQQPGESFKDYLLAVQDLMYHSKLSAERKLEIIFRNSLPDYQWFIKRKDFNTLDELLALADELECIPASKHPASSEYYRMLKDRSLLLPPEKKDIVSETLARHPALLTQGRNPRLPRALYDEVTVGIAARCVGPDERAHGLNMFKTVSRNLEKASKKQRYHNNQRRRNWTPVIGDHVLIRQHPLSKAVNNVATKLAAKFKGPYIVTRFLSPVIVEVRAVETSEGRTAHISELKPHYPTNQLFSTFPSRFPKSDTGRSSDRMEAEREKCEKSRKKLRRGIKQENATVWQTVFLTSDETPGISKSRRDVPRPQSSRNTIQRSQTVVICKDPAFEQLPLELRMKIAKIQHVYKGKRTRFRQSISGRQLRITISRNGTVRVTTAKKKERSLIREGE